MQRLFSKEAKSERKEVLLPKSLTHKDKVIHPDLGKFEVELNIQVHICCF